MDSTQKCHGGLTESLKASWKHCQEMLLASSLSGAWQSFKKMVDGVPCSSLVVMVILIAALVVSRSLVMTALMFAGSLCAVYLTVKCAVSAALREHGISRPD